MTHCTVVIIDKEKSSWRVRGSLLSRRRMSVIDVVGKHQRKRSVLLVLVGLLCCRNLTGDDKDITQLRMYESLLRASTQV